MPQLVIAYGPYMNWGRWNHNTYRISTLLNALLDEGYAVELRHDEKEEGDGWVSIIYDGNEIARTDDVQHNRNYNKRDLIFSDMKAEVLEQVKMTMK